MLRTQLLVVLIVGILSGQAAAQQLAPEWYRQHMVHAHTRLWYVDMEGARHGTYWNTPEYATAQEGLAALGASVVTRHAKTFSEDPWWPSLYPSVDGASPLTLARVNDGETVVAGENRVLPWLRETGRLTMIAYYWISSNDRFASANPDFVCNDKSGIPDPHRLRGAYLDFTTPGYGDLVLEHFKDLQRMGARGVYIDGRLLQPGGCYSATLLDAYKAETGVALRADSNVALHRAFLRFGAERMANAIAEWQKAMSAIDPEFALIVSTTTIPGLTLQDMSLDLVRAAIPKTEFNIALRPGLAGLANVDETFVPPDQDVRIAFGIMLLRDISGRPPHVWIDQMVEEEKASATVGAVTSFGAIANIDVAEEHISGTAVIEGKMPRELMPNFFRRGDALGQVMSNVAPIPWAAIYYDGAAALRSSNAKLHWTNYVTPLLGALDTLRASGAPSIVVADRELADSRLDEVSLLVIHPDDRASLTEDLRTVLAAFESRGGRIVAPEDLPAALSELQLPVHVRDLPPGAFLNSFASADGRKLVLSLTNAFAWAAPQEWDGGRNNQPAPPPIPSSVAITVSASLLPAPCETLSIYDPVEDRSIEVTATTDQIILSPGEIEHSATIVLSCDDPS